MYDQTSCRTPSYASPEVFIDPTTASFQADIWSLTVSLFHLVSGELPFESSTPIIATVNISDLSKPAPDIRDKTPPERQISPSFAAVIAKGLEKTKEKRFRSVDEMSTALHRCLVQQGSSSYSIFISSSEFLHDKILALVLYKSLNNNTTPNGNKVFVCMRPLEIEISDAWEEFPLCIMNSRIAIPILSVELVESLKELKGSDEDPEHRYLKELILMQILSNDAGCVLKKIFPVLSDFQGDVIDSSSTLVPREPTFTMKAVKKFLKLFSRSTRLLNEPESIQEFTVSCTISSLLALSDQNENFSQELQSKCSQEQQEDQDQFEESLINELKDILTKRASGREGEVKSIIRKWAPKLKFITDHICKLLDNVRNISH